jgi:ligand-binding sensor domain-containing protein
MYTTALKYSFLKILQTLLTLLFLAFKLNGQSFILTHYTSKDGLAHDNVRDITADSSGFIWMATWDGLSRYDGTEFKNYYHDPGDSTSIQYFSIDRVVVDAADNLWLTTDDGKVCIMNRAAETFHVISHINDHSLSGLINFCSAPDGFMYFVLFDEILKYDPKNGGCISYKRSGKIADSTSPGYNRYDIIYDGNDHLWLAGTDVIEFQLTTDDSGNSGTALVKSVNRIERKKGRVGSFFEETGAGRITRDRSGNTWLAARTGLFLFEREKNLFSEYSGNTIEISFADTLPIMFYDHLAGLKIWLPQNDTLIKIPPSECGIPVNFCYYNPYLFWISYQGLGGTPAGICKVVISPYEFTLINPFPVTNSELTVFGITEDKRGSLWIAARDRNYLIRISRDGIASRIKLLNDDESNELWHPRAFLTDNKGIWIGYFYNELIYYTPAGWFILYHLTATEIYLSGTVELQGTIL